MHVEQTVKVRTFGGSFVVHMGVVTGRVQLGRDFSLVNPVFPVSYRLHSCYILIHLRAGGCKILALVVAVPHRQSQVVTRENCDVTLSYGAQHIFSRRFNNFSRSDVISTAEDEVLGNMLQRPAFSFNKTDIFPLNTRKCVPSAEQV